MALLDFLAWYNSVRVLKETVYSCQFPFRSWPEKTFNLILVVPAYLSNSINGEYNIFTVHVYEKYMKEADLSSQCFVVALTMTLFKSNHFKRNCP